MSAKFMTGVVAAAALIAALAAAPAQARNDHDTFAKIVIGVGSIYLLSEAIKGLDHKDRGKVSVGHSGGRGNGHGGYTRGKPPIPKFCVRRVGTKKHRQRVATRNCLKQNYRAVKRLPKACKTTFWQRGNKRKGYGLRCLRDHGYSVAGRR